jgi:hypothetical protein
MAEIQEEYIVDCIYQHTKRPEHLKSSNVYNFECPICQEGKSRGKKKRGFYIPEQKTICCHNCGWKSSPLKWIEKVTNKTFREIYQENDKFVPDFEKITYLNLDTGYSKIDVDTLPEDSINLLSDEVNYFKKDKVISDCLAYMQKRRLVTASYRPKAIYTSIKDRYCSGGVCLPFYERDGKISFYQIRNINPQTNEPKYKGKVNGDKGLFNYDKLSEKFPYVFLFEGPIDAMFIKNSVAIAGTSLASKQEAQLSLFPLHQKIWCLDNQQIDKTSKEKTDKLLKENQSVFIWPKKYKQYKDINEICCKFGLDEISPDFILKNTASNVMEAIKKGYIVSR